MADQCCGCGVDVNTLRAEQRRVLTIVLGVNIATCAIVIAGAIYSRSSSLLSGGLDNFGDALTYALSLAVIGGSLIAKSRIAVLKGTLILSAAIAVAIRIVWGVAHPGVPIVEAMGVTALLNFAANLYCLRLLTPYRHGDVNLASAWECSRNDVYEGVAVFAATGGVWLFNSNWPDLIIAAVLLILFAGSAFRVFRAAIQGMREANAGTSLP